MQEALQANITILLTQATPSFKLCYLGPSQQFYTEKSVSFSLWSFSNLSWWIDHYLPGTWLKCRSMPLIEVLWSHTIFLLVAISAFVNIRYFCSFCCWMILVGSSDRVGTEHLKEWGFEQHRGNTKKSLISFQFTSKPFIKAAQIELDSISNLKPLFPVLPLFLPVSWIFLNNITNVKMWTQ